MDEEVIDYITHHILKNGEQLEDMERHGAESTTIQLAIVKRTARTLRKVGLITVRPDAPSAQDNAHPAPPSAQDNAHPTPPSAEETVCPAPPLPLLKWTPGKRALLPEDAQTFSWLQAGWVLKELRFRQDGRSVAQIHYRMGPHLFKHLQAEKTQAGLEEQRQLEAYQQKAGLGLAALEAPLQKPSTLLAAITDYIAASREWTPRELAQSELFPPNWSVAKRIRFLHFVLALRMISNQQEQFDWKEIGAQYYGVIGGSKVFDAHKDEFISLLEEWGGQPAASYGLVSLGRITPLYFAGNLNGTWSGYRAGPVHALTDLSIAADHYITDATTLWLVENRAILTRVAAERDFLQQTSSLIACVDGHLRSSHKNFIRQLLGGNAIRQVLIWTDYDTDGLLISGELAEAAQGSPARLKWIGHDRKVMTSWPQYQRYMQVLLQEKKPLEQEQIVGGAEDWRQWINL
ncbi:DUF2399 domain-containing protein [Paenibacillus donghaensis]|nr:DUF2399 domain-containing protein [Paenibacillus donghaensis]